MDTLRHLSPIAATLSVGMFAGVFFIYSNATMPGLRKADDRTFVRAFQLIDTAVINPLFLGLFFGGLVFTAVAVFLHRGSEYGAALPWLVTGGVLYLVVIVLTIAINVPLNDAIKAAGDPDVIDVARVRAEFHEARWVISNHVRVVLSMGAFGSLSWALVLLGRSGA